jgi:hypothetical protein
MSPAPETYTGILGILHDWQDLIGALGSASVAAFAVIVSVSALRATRDQVELGRKQFDFARRQEEERREARLNALRAALNPALSNLCAWADGVATALKEIPYEDHIPNNARDTFEAPRVSEADLDVVVRVIEASDDEYVRRRLNRLISNIQVLSARVAMISNVRNGLSIFKGDLDLYLLNVVTIYAQISSCFAFARRQQDTIHPTLGWGDVYSAAMCLSFHGPRFCSVNERIQRLEQDGVDPENSMAPNFF